MKTKHTTALALAAPTLLLACASVMPYLGHGAAIGQAALECAAEAEPAACLQRAAEVVDTVTDMQVVECANAIRQAEETHNPEDEARARSLVESLHASR